MVLLSLGYMLTTLFVQAMRYVKRLYVRRFANNTSLSMKRIIYAHLLRRSREDLHRQEAGDLMIHIISDVDACVEGMRKFTTEIFDTGIAMAGALLILWLGGRNVMGIGWETWNIAAFAAYLSCFTRLAIKASHAAHLFNALQKADVSWRRIHPYLLLPGESSSPMLSPAPLEVRRVSFTYPGEETPVIKSLSFSAAPGEIIGITGEMASGKSTLGRLFLEEMPHEGVITWGGKELGREISPSSLIGYMGHEAEIFSASLEDNIRLGKPGNLEEALWAADLEEDISFFPEGIRAPLGDGGVRLSGGQKARIILARLIYHKRPLLILDDPFASVDYETENTIFSRITSLCKDSIILLISHRLHTFPSCSQVLWVEKDKAVIPSTHEELLSTNAAYGALWKLQEMGTERKRP